MTRRTHEDVTQFARKLYAFIDNAGIPCRFRREASEIDAAIIDVDVLGASIWVYGDTDFELCCPSERDIRYRSGDGSIPTLVATLKSRLKAARLRLEAERRRREDLRLSARGIDALLGMEHTHVDSTRGEVTAYGLGGTVGVFRRDRGDRSKLSVDVRGISEAQAYAIGQILAGC